MAVDLLPDIKTIKREHLSTLGHQQVHIQWYVFVIISQHSPTTPEIVNIFCLTTLHNPDFQVELIEMEKQRYADRMGPHLANDVWERRKEPPKNWIKKLPESHEKRIEES